MSPTILIVPRRQPKISSVVLVSDDTSFAIALPFFVIKIGSLDRDIPSRTLKQFFLNHPAVMVFIA